jgi:diaminohydroxyphosphoribosylaminopyrimidine deaminase/5-amino-6-(5-phosphoribosylamino)uracil reductase
MHDDERFMHRAIALAKTPGFTSPNPRVGAVLVRDGTVLSEGVHRGAGTPHAEVEALRDADARGATLYVNLEPCNHEGRTPPCAPLLISSGLARVVVATQDPDRRVAGDGIRALRTGGIDVTVGVLEDAAKHLNAPFLHHRSTGRSYLSLKLALSLDGRLAAPDGTSRWITGPEARARVHARRLEADAVMVGAGTIAKDNPELTARHLEGDTPRQPLRIVTDSTGRVDPSARVFSAPGSLLVATTERCPHEVQIAWKEAGAEVVVLPATEHGVDVDGLMQALGRREVMEVLCEGGAGLATSLLRADLVDRLELYQGPVLLGGGGAEIGPLGVATMADVVRWSTVAVEQLSDDALIVLERRRGVVD